MAVSIVIWALLAVLSAGAYVGSGSPTAGGVFICALLLPPLTLSLAALASRRLTVTLTLPTGAVKGEGAEGRVTVKNGSILPAARTIVRIQLKNGLTGDSAVLRVPVSAPPRGTANAAFRLGSGRCGYISAECRRISVTDAFGILRIPRACSATGGMTVLPRTFETELMFAMPRTAPEDGDDYSPTKRGYDGSETFQLREYAEGDSIKQIHWKLTGKLDKLIVRDASLPVSRSLLVFWDKSAAGAAPPEETDALAEVASSLCQALSQMGIAYHLGWSEPDSQSVTVEEIQDADALCRAVPMMIKRGGWDAVSGMARYIELFGAPQYSKIIYLSSALPDEAETFFGCGCGEALICGDTAAEPPRGVRLLLFNTENYAETLKLMELDI